MFGDVRVVADIIVTGGGGGGSPISGDYVTKTTAAKIYYVATTGSDITGIGTILSPFASIQKAIDTLPNQLNHDCTINVAAGTYNNSVYIAKVYNTSTSTKYLRIQGTKTLLTGTLTPTGFGITTITVAGAGWVVNEFVDKWFLITAGKGYSAFEFPYMIISNTADTLTFRYNQMNLVADGTTRFVIYDQATFIPRQILTVGCQKSLVVHFNAITFSATSGSQNVYDKDSAVWYSGCYFVYSGPTVLHTSVASEANYYGCLCQGSNIATTGHSAQNIAVASHYYSTFRNFAGGSNRQAVYLTNSIGGAVACYFYNNYYGVRCIQDSTYAISNYNTLFDTGNYCWYAQRGGSIDAIYALSQNYIYVNRVADGGIVEFASTRCTLYTELNFFDSAGGMAIDTDTDILYRKLVVQRQDKIADYTIPAIKSGMLFTNTGAAGEIIYTLPSAIVGLCQDFSVEVAQYLRIKAAAGDFISFMGDNSAVAGFWRCNQEGAFIRMEARTTAEWRITHMLGGWLKDV